VYLNISVEDDEIKPGLTTHSELNKTNMLSVIANLTPYSDFNQRWIPGSGGYQVQSNYCLIQVCYANNTHGV
jgi:hypothetical protein